MANSFPGSGLAYADQFAVGRSSGTGLLNTFLTNDLSTIQIRAESDTSGIVSYTGIAPAYLEYYRNITTGVDLTIQTKIQAGGSGGAIVFSPNSPSADLTPVERMRITKDGNVGIGTASPTAKLHVNGSSQFDDTLNFASRGKLSWGGSPARLILTSCGSYNLALGTDDFVDRMTIQASTGNVGIGTSSPATLDSGGVNLQIKDRSALFQLAAVNSTYLSNNIYYDGSWKRIVSGYGALIRLVDDNNGFSFLTTGTAGANSAVTFTSAMNITNAGCVGIGTTTPSYRLHVNGTFYAAGSSCEYKTQICQYNTDSCMFMKLTPVTYQYKDEWCHLGKELKSETQIGLIAEDVAEVYPELAILVNEDDQKIVRNVDYEKLSIVLLSEVQKLRKELDELKTK